MPQKCNRCEEQDIFLRALQLECLNKQRYAIYTPELKLEHGEIITLPRKPKPGDTVIIEQRNTQFQHTGKP